MKKLICTLLLSCWLASSASAFLYEVNILSKEEIHALKDDQLIDLFISAKIEVEASKSFHGKAGFNPKEYEKFKALLGLIVRLHQEMKTRELEVPPMDEWLR